MILIITAGTWLVALLLVTFAPPGATGLRKELQIDLAAIGAIIAATLGFFWRLIFTANVWMPAGGGDLAGFLYPTYHFAAEWWRSGVIPLWNPHLFAGQPFVGDIQSGIFYPLNLLAFFTTNPLTYRDLELLSVLHYIIAGAGMYTLLRWGGLGSNRTSPAPSNQMEPMGGLPVSTAQLSRAACLAGALAFEFSDLFITHFGNLNLIASASWLPLVFLFFMRAIARGIATHSTQREAGKSPRIARGSSDLNLLSNLFAPCAVGGVFLAFSFLAGHIQSFLFILLALGLFAAYRVIESRRDTFVIFAALALTLTIGLGLGALTLAPSIEMTRASVRSSFSYEDAAQYSLPPAELVGLLVPGFFGRGVQAAWGPWPRVEVGYLGVFPLILAALALIMRRNGKRLFFGLLALAGLVFALGGYAILHGWLYSFVPGFGELRAPARFILLLDFGLAALAAIGFDALLHPLTDDQQRKLHEIARIAPWVFLIVALASGGVAFSILILGQGQAPDLFARIANAANSIAFFILLLAFSVALLVARDRRYLGAMPWSLLALALIFFDLFSLGAYVDIGLSDPTAAYNRQDVVGFLQSQVGPFRIDSRTDAQGIWLPDTVLLYGLSDVNGDNPLVLSDFDRYWEALGSRASRMYDLLNTKYVLARRNTPLDVKFQRVFDGASGISIYENRAALPRAWVVYAGQVVPAGGQTLDRVDSPQFDPMSDVILQGENALALPESGLSSDGAQVVGYGPNEIDLEATAKQEGYLVLSEVYYPGWKAIVDGRETDIFRADDLFRAILLPPGAHQIRFVYDPLSFKLGAVISGLTILGIVSGGIYLLRQQLLNPHD